MLRTGRSEQRRFARASRRQNGAPGKEPSEGERAAPALPPPKRVDKGTHFLLRGRGVSPPRAVAVACARARAKAASPRSGGEAGSRGTAHRASATSARTRRRHAAHLSLRATSTACMHHVVSGSTHTAVKIRSGRLFCDWLAFTDGCAQTSGPPSGRRREEGVCGDASAWFWEKRHEAGRFGWRAGEWSVGGGGGLGEGV